MHSLLTLSSPSRESSRPTQVNFTQGKDIVYPAHMIHCQAGPLWRRNQNPACMITWASMATETRGCCTWNQFMQQALPTDHEHVLGIRCTSSTMAVGCVLAWPEGQTCQVLLIHEIMQARKLLLPSSGSRACICCQPEADAADAGVAGAGNIGAGVERPALALASADTACSSFTAPALNLAGCTKAIQCLPAAAFGPLLLKQYQQ